MSLFAFDMLSSIDDYTIMNLPVTIAYLVGLCFDYYLSLSNFSSWYAYFVGFYAFNFYIQPSSEQWDQLSTISMQIGAAITYYFFFSILLES